MMSLPAEAELTHLQGGLNEYLTGMKNMGCIGCHQLGQQSTRTVPEFLGHFESSEEAWLRRISSGQAGQQMAAQVSGRLGAVPLKYLADWTDRVTAGAIPPTQPERPTGAERNVVATIRDWATPTVYMHDLSSTDWRNPTANAYGRIYGAEHR